MLAALREQAIVQSAESSNRIEGVTIPAERLRPVVLGKSHPRDRSEEGLAGYRRALEWIFSSKGPVRITPDVIRHLHRLAQGGSSGDAGEWKTRDNEIVEIAKTGERRIRFVPVTAKRTPAAIGALCMSYESVCTVERIPSLLAVATFVFDFLCIHPFRDGNGRVSRLLTTLLLQSHGFQVARYVSLERLAEGTREDYYRVLGEYSRGWHEGRNEILPWWNYFLGIVRSGYRELALQLEPVPARPAKGELVRRAVLNQAGEFTLGDLTAQLPGASPQLVKKVLYELKHEGRVTLLGRGRGARWTLSG